MPTPIDVLLVVAGLACLAGGHWPAGLALAGFGLVTPLAQRSGRRRFKDPAGLVPTELAEAHRQVVAAAALPGVDGATRVVEASEDALLEVAALLGGPPATRGGPAPVRRRPRDGAGRHRGRPA